MNPSSIKANPVQINKSLSINHEHNTCSYPLRSTVHRTEALRVTVNETNFTKTQWHPCVYPEILAILFYAIIISNMSVQTQIRRPSNCINMLTDLTPTIPRKVTPSIMYPTLLHMLLKALKTTVPHLYTSHMTVT